MNVEQSISANRIRIASEKRRGKMIKTFHIVIGQKALVGGVACATFASLSQRARTTSRYDQITLLRIYGPPLANYEAGTDSETKDEC